MQASLALLAACFGLGVLARWSGKFPDGTVPVLNAWLLRIALPALVLRTIHGLTPDPALFPAAASIWLVFLVAAALALLAHRAGLVTRAQAGGLALTAGCCNTAFVGLPFVEGVAGAAGLEVAVVVDQLGSFLLVSVLALPLAARMGGKGLSTGEVLWRVILFPPFIALLAAVLMRPLTFPTLLDSILRRLGDTLSPLALFTVGYQLRLGALRGRAVLLVTGLGYKLLLAPLMVASVLRVLGVHGLPYKVTVTQAAMAPMVTAAILAAEYDLDGEFAALMVGVGVPLSLLTASWIWTVL